MLLFWQDGKLFQWNKSYFPVWGLLWNVGDLISTSQVNEPEPLQWSRNLNQKQIWPFATSTDSTPKMKRIHASHQNSLNIGEISLPPKTRFTLLKYILLYTHVIATTSDSSFKNTSDKLKLGLYSISLSQSQSSVQWRLDSDVKLYNDNNDFDFQTQHGLNEDRISNDGIWDTHIKRVGRAN